MRIRSGGVSDVGRVRTNNEDCYRLVPEMGLFVLSDGMGGEAHGEVASAMAVETVVKHCLEGENNPAAPIFGETQPGWSAKTKRLSSAVHLANKKIYESAAEHSEQTGMGATLTAAWISEERLSIAHVGDSRAYILRTGALQQLTSDHSLVAEQVRRGILTAAQAEESERVARMAIRIAHTILLAALRSGDEIIEPARRTIGERARAERSEQNCHSAGSLRASQEYRTHARPLIAFVRFARC